MVKAKYPVRTVTNWASRIRTPESIKQAKLLRVLNLLLFMKKPRHITDIAKKLDVSQRTAYRYLKLIEGLDIAIDKDFNDSYFIAQDTCPMCGKEVHHG